MESLSEKLNRSGNLKVKRRLGLGKHRATLRANPFETVFFNDLLIISHLARNKNPQLVVLELQNAEHGYTILPSGFEQECISRTGSEGEPPACSSSHRERLVETSRIRHSQLTHCYDAL